MLEAALAAGIASAGGDAMIGGVLPTPAASILARRLDFDLAAVVSASHNPYGDNGIKFFAATGCKLDDDRRGRDRGPPGRSGRAKRSARVRELEGAFDDYLRELRTAFPLDLERHEGRARLRQRRHLPRRARRSSRRLGAEVEAIANEPDGRNINDGCGATHPEALAERVAEPRTPTIGFAFDGDGDRADRRRRRRDRSATATS